MPRWDGARPGWLGAARLELVLLPAAMGDATAGRITGRESGAGVTVAKGAVRANAGAGVSSDGSGG